MREFSIITPSFNSLPWIKACVWSVADQQVDHEHLVQEGRSSDGAIDWLSAQPGIDLQVEKDTGMYDAINRGLRRAQGGIFAWLNADEQYLPGALSAVAEVFQQHPAIDIVLGDALLIDAEGSPLAYRRIVAPHLVHTRLCHLGSMSCSAFFRRRIIDEGLLLDPAWKAIGDAEWMYRLLRRGMKVRPLPQPLAAFTFTGKNLGSSPVALHEAGVWAAGLPGWQRALRPLVQGAHRLRKMAAGAYRERDVEISIYPPQGQQQVRETKSGKVGFRWAESSA